MLTKQQEEEIIKLRKQGFSYKKIHEKTGISLRTIADVLKGRRSTKKTETYIRNAIENLIKQKSEEEIIQIFDIGSHVYYNYKKFATLINKNLKDLVDDAIAIYMSEKAKVEKLEKERMALLVTCTYLYKLLKKYKSHEYLIARDKFLNRLVEECLKKS